MSPPKTPDVPVEDFYALLGVEKTATEAEIKTAYRKLALKYHPDRNAGDQEAQELFKKISIAYAVLSDPNKRRQYDVSGPSSSQLDFEGFDLTELGGVGRMFGALFTKLGVPIPTQITPKVLAQARSLSENNEGARNLQPGESIGASVAKQEADFYAIEMKDEYKRNGISIVCRSPSSSKFKLVLFDKEGGVRMIQESQKKKSGTQAELFFVPHTIVNIGEFNPMKVHMENRDTPLPFHYLDLLETQTAQLLDSRKHILCVYGDNWINSVKYTITFLPIDQSSMEDFAQIQEVEKELSNKKSEMAKFQIEYATAKKKYEEACARLKFEDKDIQEKLKQREKYYEAVISSSQARYQTNISPAKQSRGLFDKMSAPRTIYLVPARTSTPARSLTTQRASVPRVIPTGYRPVQASPCLKRPAATMTAPVEDPLEVLLNDGSGQGPPRKRERLNHLSVEEKLNRRKLKNRVAAQTARDRKKARSQRLEEVVRQLMDENQKLREENSRLRTEHKQREWTPAEGTGYLSSASVAPPLIDLIPQEALDSLFQDLQGDFDLDQLASELPFEEDSQDVFPVESAPLPPPQVGCPLKEVPSSPCSSSSYISGSSPIPSDDWIFDSKIDDPMLSSSGPQEIDHEESVWDQQSGYDNGSPFSESFNEEFYCLFS